MRGGLGCGNITPPPLRMLDVPSAYLPQNDDGYPDHYGAHGFVAPSGRSLSLEEHCFGLGKQDAIDSAGDQQSAVTNMSNITSASGEASGSSGERDAIANGAGRGGAGVSQLPISSIASSGGLNSNGLSVVVKKKRNLPGNPDPDAEVVALSPKTLMATNRFVCEICNKGFQRDQNLQLHRRGHNLPWKLKQRSSKEVRKRVYICPEVSCVHHDPARALGDLTGIKKHFCRKHGEKKWKCDKCSKRYAVQSDWKAHSKTCGTREYRCDCGVLFSRRDSFITHRAFCDALTEESARVGAAAGSGGMAGMMMGGHGVHVHSPPSSRSTLSRLAAGAPDSMIDHSSGSGNVLAGASMLDNTGFISPTTGRPRLSLWLGSGPNDQLAGSHDHFALDPFGNASTSSFFAENFEAAKPSYASHTASHVADMAGISSIAGPGGSLANHPNLNLTGGISGSANPSSGLASLPSVSTLFSQANVASTAQTSATALLQKAARMGATASDPHLFRGFSSPLYPPPLSHASPTPRPLASHLDFLPPLPLQSSYSGFFQQKLPGIDDLRSSMSSRISAADVFQMNCSNSFTNNAGANRLQELMPSLPAPPTNSAPLRMEYILQPKPATGAPFSMNSLGSENRDPNPLLPPPTLTKDDSGSMGLHANLHPQGKFAMMGFGGNITPKSEDGITRDFLGVRCLDTVFGNQEHAAAPVPGFTQSYSQKDFSSTMHRLGMDRYSSSPRDGMI